MRFSIRPVQKYEAGYPGGKTPEKGKRVGWQQLSALFAGMLVALWGGGCTEDDPTILTGGDEDSVTEQEAEADALDADESFDDPWEDIAGGFEPTDGDADPEPEIDEEEYVLDGDIAMYRVAK